MRLVLQLHLCEADIEAHGKGFVKTWCGYANRCCLIAAANQPRCNHATPHEGWTYFSACVKRLQPLEVPKAWGLGKGNMPS